MQQFINNWGDTLTAQVLVGATTIPVSLAKAALISDASVDNFYLATLMDVAASNPDIDAVEVVKITAANGGTGDLTVVRAQDGTTAKQWEAADTIDAMITAQSMSDIRGREILIANRTYYVATTGLDTNDGLTVGTPFLTIQKAIDVLASLDISIYDVTVNVADGTYTNPIIAKSCIGAGSVSIIGNTTTPANCVLSVTNDHVFYFENVNSTYNISGFKLITTTLGSCIRASGAGNKHTIADIEFGATAEYHIYLNNGAELQGAGDLGIVGGAFAFARVQTGSWFSGGAGNTITVTGTPNFTTAFMYATISAMVQMFSVTITGTATGKRYLIDILASCNVYGGGANYFPGDVAGTVADGGLYIS